MGFWDRIGDNNFEKNTGAQATEGLFNFGDKTSAYSDDDVNNSYNKSVYIGGSNSGALDFGKTTSNTEKLQTASTEKPLSFSPFSAGSGNQASGGGEVDSGVAGIIGIVGVVAVLGGLGYVFIKKGGSKK